MIDNIQSSELNANQQEEELFSKRVMLAELIKGAAKSENPEAAFEFLSNDKNIKDFLGEDKTLWPTKAKELYNSVEGFGTDYSRVGAATAVAIGGVGATVGIQAGAGIGALIAGPIGALIGILPGAVAGAMLMFISAPALAVYILLGISMIIYTCVVRLKRYKTMIEDAKAAGLDQLKLDRKSCYSAYLPVYTNFAAKVKQIETLKSLCEYALKNARKLDVIKMRTTFGKVGLEFGDDGKVTAGKHVDWSQTDNQNSTADKGWDAKKLTMACNVVLKLIASVGHIELNKNNLEGQIPNTSIKVLRGALKEMNFWLLDLARGVAVAADACRYK